jgi:hypothetical protein
MKTAVRGPCVTELLSGLYSNECGESHFEETLREFIKVDDKHKV